MDHTDFLADGPTISATVRYALRRQLRIGVFLPLFASCLQGRGPPPLGSSHDYPVPRDTKGLALPAHSEVPRGDPVCSPVAIPARRSWVGVAVLLDPGPYQRPVGSNRRRVSSCNRRQLPPCDLL